MFSKFPAAISIFFPLAIAILNPQEGEREKDKNCDASCSCYCCCLLLILSCLVASSFPSSSFLLCFVLVSAFFFYPILWRTWSAFPLEQRAFLWSHSSGASIRTSPEEAAQSAQARRLTMPPRCTSLPGHKWQSKLQLTNKHAKGWRRRTDCRWELFSNTEP